jgi:hypothetical protein
MKQPLKATFNVLGCDIELSEDECRTYEDVCENFLSKLPDEAVKRLNKLSAQKRVDILAQLLVDIDIKLDTPSVYTDSNGNTHGI